MFRSTQSNVADAAAGCQFKPRRATALIQEADGNGDFVSNGALCGSMQPRQADIARIRQRISRTAAELSYDIIVWICGMLASAWVTRDLSPAAVMQAFSLRVTLAVGVLVPACGLLAGLYRSRYQRAAPCGPGSSCAPGAASQRFCRRLSGGGR